MSELKPCPFCGGDAYISDEYEFKAACSNVDCYCSLNEKAIRDGYDDGFINKKDAIEEWNTRHNSSVKRQTIEELLALHKQDRAKVNSQCYSLINMSTVDKYMETLK